MIEVVLDFETLSACDLKKAGAWRYAEDPTTEIICLAYGVVGGNPPTVLVPEDLAAQDEHLLMLVNNPDVLFIAHNVGFEKAIWRRIMVEQYGWPDIPNSRWHDTMAMCAMRVIPQDLERALMVLRLPNQKDTVGSKLTRGLSKPRKDGSYDRSEATLRRVYEYNASDINGEVGLHRRLGVLPAGERQVWLLDQRINERGVGIDLSFVSAALAIVEGASVPLRREFAEITGGLAVGQRDKVIAWAKDAGAAIPDLKKETLAAILGDEDDEEDDHDPNREGYIHLPENVHRALSIRRLIGSASIKKLARMDACTCADGRARGLLQYHGAGPGLWAGRLFQPQNFPRGTLKVDKKPPSPDLVVDCILSRDWRYVEQMLGPAVEVVVSGLRHAIQASPGRKLVAGDFSGVQARIVLALAGQHDKTALMASGASPYLDMAEAIYRRHGLNKEEHPQEYATGKFAVLGLGFQMGAQKFRDRYAKDQPSEFAENVVRTYRYEWAPLIPKLWYSLEAAAVKAVWDRVPTTDEIAGIEYRLEDGWLTARLLSGRKLWYFNPQPIRKTMPWDDTDVRRAWTYQATKMGQWRTIDAFGGLLTENVVMACQRDLMTRAMFTCEKQGLPVILNVHDEIITEPEESNKDAPKVLEQIMTDVPEWAKAIQVPIAVGVWEGDRYKK